MNIAKIVVVFVSSVVLLVAASRCLPVLAQGTATETISFEINIEPVFVVETQSDEGGDITLGPLLPDGEDAFRTVEVIVHTNRGEPYAIVQQLEQELVSGEGFTFSSEQIRFSASDGINGGRSEVEGLQPLMLAPVVVFSSNVQGDADRFTISYFTSAKRVIPSGGYRARILIYEELQ